MSTASALLDAKSFEADLRREGGLVTYTRVAAGRVDPNTDRRIGDAETSYRVPAIQSRANIARTGQTNHAHRASFLLAGTLPVRPKPGDVIEARERWVVITSDDIGVDPTQAVGYTVEVGR